MTRWFLTDIPVVDDSPHQLPSEEEADLTGFCYDALSGSGRNLHDECPEYYPYKCLCWCHR